MNVFSVRPLIQTNGFILSAVFRYILIYDLEKMCFFLSVLPEKRANHPLKIQEKRVMLFLA